MKVNWLLGAFVVAAALAMLFGGGPARADFINGDLENGAVVNNQGSWTAGTDAANAWYAGPYVAIVNDSGNHYLSDQATGVATGFDHIQDVLYAMRMPDPGTYAFNVSAQFSNDYNDQFAGFNVLLLQSGVTIPLTQTGYWPGVMSPPANSVDILDWDPGNGTGANFDGLWHNLSNTFTITPAEASAYSYVVFYAWGDRSDDANHDQTGPMNWDNFATDVPEPSSLALLAALGAVAGLAFVRRGW